MKLKLILRSITFVILRAMQQNIFITHIQRHTRRKAAISCITFFAHKLSFSQLEIRTMSFTRQTNRFSDRPFHDRIRRPFPRTLTWWLFNNKICCYEIAPRYRIPLKKMWQFFSHFWRSIYVSSFLYFHLLITTLIPKLKNKSTTLPWTQN